MAFKRKKIISNYFKPSIYVKTFKDINIATLKSQGIKVFVADLDNTLVPHFTLLPNKHVLDFIKRIRGAGMEFVIMSNNTKKRVGFFAEKAGVSEWYSNSLKPFLWTGKKILQKHNIYPSEMIVMGDQIIMDILIANRLKCKSVLVQPLVSTDYKMNRFNIFLEKVIYKNLEKNNIMMQNNFEDNISNSDLELL